MIVSVRMAEWELQDMGWVVEIGDELSLWLTFDEARGDASAGGEIQTIRGVARPLPSWPGAILRAHPVQIDLEGGALYWEAPAPTTGPLEVTGTVSWNTIDAPDGFPETRGVVRRVRMVWRDHVMGRDRQWAHAAGPRYEEVRASYFPPVDVEPLDPVVEADLRRRARQAYDAEVAAGRLRPGDPFQVGLKVTHPVPPVPPGTTETRWTGVLVDLDLAGSPA